MEVKFVNYQRDYLRFAKEYDAAWYRVNLQGDLILRKDVEEFDIFLLKKLQKIAGIDKTKSLIVIH